MYFLVRFESFDNIFCLSSSTRLVPLKLRSEMDPWSTSEATACALLTCSSRGLFSLHRTFLAGGEEVSMPASVWRGSTLRRENAYVASAPQPPQSGFFLV